MELLKWRIFLDFIALTLTYTEINVCCIQCNAASPLPKKNRLSRSSYDYDKIKIILFVEKYSCWLDNASSSLIILGYLEPPLILNESPGLGDFYLNVSYKPRIYVFWICRFQNPHYATHELTIASCRMAFILMSNHILFTWQWMVSIL